MENFCFKRGFRAKNGGEGRSEGAQRREIRPSADAMRGVAAIPYNARGALMPYQAYGNPKTRFARFGEPLLRLG